jgi:hypothetical protein
MPTQIEKLIAKHYTAQAEGMGEILGELTTDDTLKPTWRPRRIHRPGHAQVRRRVHPVKKLLNLVLLQAIKDKASDIHFEPFEDEFKMRYRIDGVLYEMMPPPKHIADGDRSAASRSWPTWTSPSAAAAGRPHRADGQQPARSTCASACCRRCSASRW